MNIGSTSTLTYKPFATFALIGICVLMTLVAASSSSGSNPMESFELSYGDGMKPVQWFVSPFVHSDMILLAGNVVFLFLFGAFIEGKASSPIFVIVFFAIAVSANAIEQGAMLGYENKVAADLPTVDLKNRTTPLTEEEKAILREADKRRLEKRTSKQWKPSPGMSSTILGLMAICLIWGPGSRYLFGTGADALEVPMLIPVALCVVWEVAKWVLSGFDRGGSPIHLVAIVPGAVVGTVLLYAGLANTGGSNLFGVSDRQGSTSDAPTASGDSSEAPPESREDRKRREASKERDRKEAAVAKAALLREAAASAPRPAQIAAKRDPQIQRAIELADEGQIGESVKSINAVSDADALAQFPIEHYSTLYQALAKEKRWPLAIMVLEKSIQGHPEDCVEQRLQLSRLFMAMKKPDLCQNVLGKIVRKQLSPEQDRLYKQLVLQIRQAAG